MPSEDAATAKFIDGCRRSDGTVTGKLVREIIGPPDQNFQGKLVRLGLKF